MMLFPESKSTHLDPQLFRNPTATYRGIPFWSWNCTVTEELIDEQLDIFKAMGFGGVDIHPRSGLNTPYLSDRYMQLIRYTVDRCKEKGLVCWLYDDDRFPSGAAAGLVTKDWRFRQRCLLLTEQERPDFFPDQHSFDCAIAAGEKPCGWFAAAYAVAANSARRIQSADPLLPGESRRYAYVMLLEPEDWFQGQTYADVMNPEAIRAFIDLTHEYYYCEVGEDFGDAVPAIFTDEPRMETRTNRHAKQLSCAASHEDVIIPWSDALRERLQKEQGIDLLDIAPALVWELPESPQARYHFRNAASEQFVSAFMDQIADWCKAHNILLTGHVLSEDSLLAQASSLGDCMRCYRSMDIPGIDVLCDERQFLAAKQAASVAHQMQREGVVSELYGVTQWNCDFKTFKLQGDWQAALGINIRVPHLAWMSMEGEAKRDWPGSIFYQAPWWKEFRFIEDYFARLNTALTRGTPLIHTAVIHPVESVWLHQGNNADTLPLRKAMSDRFDRMVKGLLANLTDFDLISESLLPSQQPSVDSSGLHLGSMTYRTLIVPDMETIRSSTLDILESFHRQGGRIIFAGQIPHLVDAQPSQRVWLLAQQCEQAGTPDALTAMLDEENDLHIYTAQGCKASNLLCQWRQEGDRRWLFLCQAWPKQDQPLEPEACTLRIRGCWTPTCYDALAGKISPMACRWEEGDTLLTWYSYAEDSLLLCLDRGETIIPPLPAPSCESQAISLKPERLDLAEPNMLLLDYAQASLDGGPWSDRMEILRLDNALRGQLGFKLRYGSMMQPYALEEKEVHNLKLRYEFSSEVQTYAELALEHPEVCRILLNGTSVPVKDQGWYVDQAIRRIPLPLLRKGRNILEIHLPYHQKTNLENLYLLGTFDVALHPAGESILLSPAVHTCAGDLTRQGKPFYSGKVTYRFTFAVETQGCYKLHVPEFAAALLTVRVDGKAAGYIAFAPHALVLGTLAQGDHVIEIDAYIGRHNGFAYLHNSNDHFVWYGPDAWRTQGDQWTDDYRVLPAGILSPVAISRLLDCTEEGADS